MADETLLTFNEVRKNKIKSVLLVLILAAIILLFSAAIGYFLDDVRQGLVVGAVVTAIVIPVQFITAKAAILAMTKGKKADRNNPEELRAINTVEGLAISAGLSRVPDVYIVPSDVPNAFASGMNEKTAFIGVTRGLLTMMDKQELEGVIAHEISHIVHRDIMLSQLAVAMVSIIVMLGYILSRLGFYGRRSRSNNDSEGKAGAFMLIVTLFAILVYPFSQLIANLIQLSISRKREFAADAYAVRLCGYSGGLASALEKLSGQPYSKEAVDSLGGKQMQCLYINFPLKNASSLFSTHPPIEERIRRLRNMY